MNGRNARRCTLGSFGRFIDFGLTDVGQHRSTQHPRSTFRQSNESKQQRAKSYTCQATASIECQCDAGFYKCTELTAKSTPCIHLSLSDSVALRTCANACPRARGIETRTRATRRAPHECVGMLAAAPTCIPELPADFEAHREFTPSTRAAPVVNSTLYWSVSLQRSRLDIYEHATRSLRMTTTDPAFSGLAHSALVNTSSGRCSCKVFHFTSKLSTYSYVGRGITNCTRMPDAHVRGQRVRHWSVDADEPKGHYEYYAAEAAPWPVRVESRAGTEDFSRMAAALPPFSTFAAQACCASAVPASAVPAAPRRRASAQSGAPAAGAPAAVAPLPPPVPALSNWPA